MGVYIHGVTANELVHLLTTRRGGKLKYTEVAEPHGRLVDLDEMCFNHSDWYYLEVPVRDLDKIKVIIEAEGDLYDTSEEEKDD